MRAPSDFISSKGRISRYNEATGGDSQQVAVLFIYTLACSIIQG